MRWIEFRLEGCVLMRPFRPSLPRDAGNHSSLRFFPAVLFAPVSFDFLHSFFEQPPTPPFVPCGAINDGAAPASSLSSAPPYLRPPAPPATFEQLPFLLSQHSVILAPILPFRCKFPFSLVPDLFLFLTFRPVFAGEISVHPASRRPAVGFFQLFLFSGEVSLLNRTCAPVESRALPFFPKSVLHHLILESTCRPIWLTVHSLFFFSQNRLIPLRPVIC